MNPNYITRIYGDTYFILECCAHKLMAHPSFVERRRFLHLKVCAIHRNTAPDSFRNIAIPVLPQNDLRRELC
jgi:hypothetical protein